jgi:hypothetical protein
MSIQHLQIGAVHVFFHKCVCEDGFEHKIVIKTPSYKHTILHAEPNLKDAKLHAIDVVYKLGLVSEEDVKEALSQV